MMQLVSPRFRIKMGTIHQNLHVSYLLNDIHHIEVTLNPLFKMVIEPVGFCKILAATIAAHKPQEPHAAVVKPFAWAQTNNFMSLDFLLKFRAHLKISGCCLSWLFCCLLLVASSLEFCCRVFRSACHLNFIPSYWTSCWILIVSFHGWRLSALVCLMSSLAFASSTLILRLVINAHIELLEVSLVSDTILRSLLKHLFISTPCKIKPLCSSQLEAMLGKWKNAPVQEDHATLCDSSKKCYQKPESEHPSVVFHTKSWDFEGLLHQ